MPDAEKILIIMVIVQAAVLFVLLAGSVKLVRERRQSLAAVYLSFCLALWLFTDIYWVVYDLMRPDERMPFAANEIGEAGMLLVLASLIGCVFDTFGEPPVFSTVCAVIFGICNIALWIGWSGEWAQDIFIGLVLSWDLYNTAASLRKTEALSKRGWILTGILCLLLISAQTLTFFADENISKAADICGYAILVAETLYLLAGYVYLHNKNLSRKTSLSLSVALLVWIIVSKYMSSGGWYTFFLCLETCFIPLLYINLKRVVKSHDLC